MEMLYLFAKNTFNLSLLITVLSTIAHVNLRIKSIYLEAPRFTHTNCLNSIETNTHTHTHTQNIHVQWVNVLLDMLCCSEHLISKLETLCELDVHTAANHESQVNLL